MVFSFVIWDSKFTVVKTKVALTIDVPSLSLGGD